MTKYYTVRLQKGSVGRTVRVSATSETNARYLAEKANAGFTAIDVRTA